MRYLKTKTITVVTSDSLIEDLQEIKDLLTSIYKKELDFSIKINGCPKADLARVIKINDLSFSFRAITKTSSMIRSVKYSDVEFIQVDCSASDASAKPESSRWITIEPLSILEEKND